MVRRMIKDSEETEDHDELTRLALLHGINAGARKSKIRRKLREKGVEVSADD